MLFRSSVSDCSIARPGGYVYMIFSRVFKSVYIGQTASRRGAFGRLAQHISEASGCTLRDRICQLYKYEEVEIGPVDFAAWKLRACREFDGSAREHREAVEAILQREVIRYICARRLRVCVISRIILNRCVTKNIVAEESEAARKFLFEWLAEVAGPSQ